METQQQKIKKIYILIIVATAAHKSLLVEIDK